MKQLDFKKLRVIEDFKKERIKEGDVFLQGQSMAAQQQSKMPGQQISYYKCIKADKEGKNIEYMLVTDKLVE